MAAINTLRENMLAMNESGTSWQAIGNHYGINKGLAWKVANTNYEPKSSYLRRVLGLPITAPAPICPLHGKVHTKRCTASNPRTLSDYRDLFAAPVDVLRAALEDREEM